MTTPEKKTTFNEDVSLNRPIDPVLQALPAPLLTGLGLSNDNQERVLRGRSILVEGRPLTTLYLVTQGWSVSKRSIGTGSSQILDIFGPGSLIGLDQIAGGGLDGYCVVALQEIDLYPIPLKPLLDIADQNPTVSQWLISALSRHVQRTQVHVAALGQLQARGRLAFAMLRILDVAQQTGRSMVDKTIHLPMTQEDIGNMLGLTNVSVSKLMSAFRHEGLIDYGRNRLMIRNVEALSEICGVQIEGAETADTISNDRRPVRPVTFLRSG